MEDQTLEIASEVGKADLGLGPIEPDGAIDQPHAVFPMGEDMLDVGAHCRLAGIGLGSRSSIARPGGFLR